MLSEGYKWITCIPCFARPDLIKKPKVAMDQETSTTRAFAKAYKFEEGMGLHFDLSKYSDSDRDILVDLDNIPILPPSTRTTRKIVDNTYYTDGSMLTWEVKNYLVSFVDGIEWLTNTYNAEQKDAPYVPLVHALNKTNIQNKYLRLLCYYCVLATEAPKMFVPKMMDGHGEMTLICHDKTNSRDTYSTAANTEGVRPKNWSMLHHGRARIFLFFTSILKREN
ncbi:hypothetical protein VPH35_033025 [Triticum aestivum]